MAPCGYFSVNSDIRHIRRDARRNVLLHRISVIVDNGDRGAGVKVGVVNGVLGNEG